MYRIEVFPVHADTGVAELLGEQHSAVLPPPKLPARLQCNGVPVQRLTARYSPQDLHAIGGENHTRTHRVNVTCLLIPRDIHSPLRQRTCERQPTDTPANDDDPRTSPAIHLPAFNPARSAPDKHGQYETFSNSSGSMNPSAVVAVHRRLGE